MRKTTDRQGARGGNDRSDNTAIPAVIAPREAAPKVTTPAGSFDLDDPHLPSWITDAALGADNYPYDRRLKSRHYRRELARLQIELVKLQHHIKTSGLRMVALFEGRDAAGKGGTIGALRQYMNPRTARIVALPKPNDR
ncbi:MAG: polyphosphate kinase 2, partial [Alphaproteobacteria bacterium]